VTTSLWVEPYVLYRYHLHAPLRPYLVKYGIYSLVVAALWLLTDRVCSLADGSLATVFLVRLVICILLPNLGFLLVYGRTWEFRFLVEKMKKPAEQVAFTREETALLHLLSAALHPAETGTPEAPEPDWEALLKLADRHAVSGLLYDRLVTGGLLPEAYRAGLEKTAERTVLQSYRLLFLGRAVVERLASRKIPSLILKGSGVAAFYPVPELRKSGDVDILLLKPEQLSAACETLQENGFTTCGVQQALHHVVLHSPEHIEVELHTLPAEPFDNRRLNRYMQENLQGDSVQVIRTGMMGLTLPRLADGEQAYALLLHMLQHFLRSGFGLKLLCDWTVFW
jgi:hypothetical protein